MRSRVESIPHLVELPHQHAPRQEEGTGGPPDLVVLCPGLGARSLAGLEDPDVHPVRGQIVTVNAPWVGLKGYSRVKKEGGREAYLMARGDGTFICGGTRIVDDWCVSSSALRLPILCKTKLRCRCLSLFRFLVFRYRDPSPRPQTTHDILERCLSLCPSLASPSRREKSSDTAQPRPEDVEIVNVHVGLRPARKGGVRIAMGEDVKLENGRNVKVLNSYGYVSMP